MTRERGHSQYSVIPKDLPGISASSLFDTPSTAGVHDTASTYTAACPACPSPRAVHCSVSALPNLMPTAKVQLASEQQRH